MAGPNVTILSAAATPTQKSLSQQQQFPPLSRTSFERDGLQSGAANANGVKSLAASAVSFAPRGPSLNPPSNPMPAASAGSFSSDLRSQLNLSRAGSRPDQYVMEKLGDDDDAAMQEQTLAQLREALNREMKIKEGSENMLEALKDKKAKHIKDQRLRVEAELLASNQRIKDLRQKMQEAQAARMGPSTPTRTRPDVLFQSAAGFRSPQSPSRSGAGSETEEQTESPTFALAELLQALEVDGMTPDYYVSRANSLVDLFKRHPTLKYDLVWSVFGVRMQVMLLSDSREVVAAGYRMIRYAISDASSLNKIRSLNTDYLVTWSLVKDRKADVEREQALKFVRAFLDVKDGVRQMSRAVVRTIAAVAEDVEERLRPVCIETLAEIFVRDPRLLVASGGLSPLHEALADGSYKASESLTAVFLYLLDDPVRRKYLQAGHALEVLFASFTDSFTSTERVLKQSSKAICSALRTWTGLFNLAMFDLRAIRSMIQSMAVQSGSIRETVIDMLYSLLRIKSPAWATSFLAGRRLTTYGRVTNLRSTGFKTSPADTEDDNGEQNFVRHYTALLLAIFVKCDLVPALLSMTQDDENPAIRRKSTLLIGEVLKLSSRLLPPSWSRDLQLLPELFCSAARLGDESHFIATGVVYQISSVSKTLYRSTPQASAVVGLPSSHGGMDVGGVDDQPKSNAAVVFDESTFRQLLLDSMVLGSSNYSKWNWDVVLKLMEGPLTSGKRLEEAAKASKFLKRIMSFYRPFKYRFSEVKSARNTQKYVRVGCALMRTLLQSPEGLRYLTDNKLLRQIAECLAQCDPTSGITAVTPMFSKERLNDTLCGGYFAMLGILSGDPRGNQLLDRWRIFNMMYGIVKLSQRPDLIKLMLSSLDYSMQGHPRVILSQALTAGVKEIRISATYTLRTFATRPSSGVLGRPASDFRWAIQLLVSQLYDPDIDVCSSAVKILEKACNSKEHLEYIVQCRPALDHLGEIGAPLLLRFLSTSVGYHYLDGLDYISNEMDDWFLGRNDSYVSVIEASLARSFADHQDAAQDEHMHQLGLFEEELEPDMCEADVAIPPHFYRELTRTHEGCKLLREKGHFNEFAETIRDHGMQSSDAEIMVKVKGCMWAVGNVGSMELGAPFLESCDVVDQIIRIAQEHQVLSLRGTAFFVLGLISRSVHGLEILSEHGWDASTDTLGQSLGLCIPNDLDKLLSLQPWASHPITTINLPDTQQTETAKLPALPSRPRSESLLRAIEAEADPPDAQVLTVELDPDPNNHRILELVIDMANTVLYRRARNELLQIKTQKSRAAGFKQPHLFRRVLALLERYHYRLSDRNMIVALFDKTVLRQIIFDEDESDDQRRHGGRGDGESDDEIANRKNGTHSGAKTYFVSAHYTADHRTSGVYNASTAWVLSPPILSPVAATSEPPPDSDDEKYGEDDEDQDEDGGGSCVRVGDGDSSGDEQRTERQRSVSDPADMQRDSRRRG